MEQLYFYNPVSNSTTKVLLLIFNITVKSHIMELSNLSTTDTSTVVFPHS